MFSGGAINPYDDIIVKATDENQTIENWEIILNLCDKVQDEGQQGAHDVIAALLKRLAHRSPNVQLYALTVAEALTKNCGVQLHREVASKAFTQGLERLVTDRTAHDKVKKRVLALVAEWTAEWENNTDLGIMEELYNSLKAKNYKFEGQPEPAPPSGDDDARRREEEELQRVLEMSLHDKGGRGQWAEYSLASSAGDGSSTSNAKRNTMSTATTDPYAKPKYQAGYVPARTPSPRVASPQPQPQPQTQSFAQSLPQPQPQPAQPQVVPFQAAQPAQSPSASRAAAPASEVPSTPVIVTRVKALHTFEPTEPGELAFEKGDIIKVVDRGYKDWWRGQLKNRTGIFPVNYVEALPEPTAAELAKEAEQEASVFAQAVNVENLLYMLRNLDPSKDSLVDNEEIQELYRSCMSVRPKIVKLIDKYSQKRADLISMNEAFVKARATFDRMMEESLAKHSGLYEQPAYRHPQAPQVSQVPQPYGNRPGPQVRPQTAAPQSFWPGQSGPNFPNSVTPGFPPTATPIPPTTYPQAGAVPPSGYPGAPTPQQFLPQGQPPQQSPYSVHPQPGPQPEPQPGPQHIIQPNVQISPYAPPQQTPGQQHPAPAGFPTVPQPYGPQGPIPYPAQNPLQSPLNQQPQQQQQQQLQQQQQQQQQPQQIVQQQPTQHQPQVQSNLQSPIQPQPALQQPILPQQTLQQPIQPTFQSAPPQVQPQPEPELQLRNPYDDLVPAQPQPQTQSQQTNFKGQPNSIVHVQPQVQAQSPIQPQAQQAVQATQAQSNPQPQPTPAGTSGPIPVQTPPYDFVPNATYADAGVQAWASYYSQGGKDTAGLFYFKFVPGVSQNAPPPEPATQQQQQQQQAQQQAQQQQHQAQQQQQTQHQHQPAVRADSFNSLLNPFGEADPDLTSREQSNAQPQPQQHQQLAPTPLSSNVPYGQSPYGLAPGPTSPTTTKSTSPTVPSWVIPKTR